jgi:hypothetical protein
MSCRTLDYDLFGLVVLLENLGKLRDSLDSINLPLQACDWAPSQSTDRTSNITRQVARAADPTADRASAVNLATVTVPDG